MGIWVINYSEKEVEARTVKSIRECTSYIGKGVTWIDIKEPTPTVIHELGEYLNLHQLVVKELTKPHGRSHYEDFGAYLFIVVMIPRYDKQRIHVSRVSMIISKDYVLTIQHQPTHVFEPIVERLTTTGTRIRKMGTDYLLYVMIDSVVAQVFPILEKLGEHIDRIEDELVVNPTTRTLERIHRLRRELLIIRRNVWPLREILYNMVETESPLIKEETIPYLRNSYGHVVDILDIVETQHETMGEMLDVYLSSVSNRMNEVIKMLTIIGTIFIPLTFITGIYGMNFNTRVSPWNMPELNWYWGYPIIMGVMAVIAGGMMVYFKRRGWI